MRAPALLEWSRVRFEQAQTILDGVAKRGYAVGITSGRTRCLQGKVRLFVPELRANGVELLTACQATDAPGLEERMASLWQVLASKDGRASKVSSTVDAILETDGLYLEPREKERLGLLRSLSDGTLLPNTVQEAKLKKEYQRTKSTTHADRMRTAAAYIDYSLDVGEVAPARSTFEEVRALFSAGSSTERALGERRELRVQELELDLLTPPTSGARELAIDASVGAIERAGLRHQLARRAILLGQWQLARYLLELAAKDASSNKGLLLKIRALQKLYGL